VIGLAALALGLPIGGITGALGGGGGVLTVPALVYLLGQSPADATTASLVIVGAAAIAAAAGHARVGTVRWDIALPFGALGIVGAVVGTALARRIDEGALMLGFAVLMLVGAASMIRKSDREPPGLGDGQPVEYRLEGPGSTRVGLQEFFADRRLLARAVPAGLVVGALTGFFGTSGGFLAVPALVLIVGLSLPSAIGTSLAVVSVNAMAGLLARVDSAAQLDPWVVLPFTLAAVLATGAGRRAAHRMPTQVLTRAFAALLTALAVLVAVQSVLA
jgi:uncharacterized membrane protein YfcA